MIANRSTRRSENATPACARRGVPSRLWNAMPITIARIIGLKFFTPGSACSANAAAAMLPVSSTPGTAWRATNAARPSRPGPAVRREIGSIATAARCGTMAFMGRLQISARNLTAMDHSIQLIISMVSFVRIERTCRANRRVVLRAR